MELGDDCMLGFKFCRFGIICKLAFGPVPKLFG